MNKKHLVIGGFFLLATFLSACSISTDASAKNVLKNYKKAQIEIDDYNLVKDYEYVRTVAEKCKPYLASKGLELFNANRLGTLSVVVALEQRINIKVKKMEITKETKDQNKVNLDYVIDIQVIYSDGKQVDTLSKPGQATLIKENGVWRVESDWKGALEPWNDFPMKNAENYYNQLFELMELRQFMQARNRSLSIEREKSTDRHFFNPNLDLSSLEEERARLNSLGEEEKHRILEEEEKVFKELEERLRALANPRHQTN